MLRWIIRLSLLLVPVVAHAAPFLESDPYPTGTNQPTHFALVIDGAASIDVPAASVAGGAVKLRFDVGHVTVGLHNTSVKAVRIDPVWGRLESIAVPFAFTRPAPPSEVVGQKLVP